MFSKMIRHIVVIRVVIESTNKQFVEFVLATNSIPIEEVGHLAC